MQVWFSWFVQKHSNDAGGPLDGYEPTVTIAEIAFETVPLVKEIFDSTEIPAASAAERNKKKKLEETPKACSQNGHTWMRLSWATFKCCRLVRRLLGECLNE